MVHQLSFMIRFMMIYDSSIYNSVTIQNGACLILPSDATLVKGEEIFSMIQFTVEIFHGNSDAR